MSMTAWVSRSTGWRGLSGRKVARVRSDRVCTARVALRRILPEATGTVVEIGAGSAFETAGFDRGRVARLIASDLGGGHGRPADRADRPAGNGQDLLTLPDGSADTVVSTHALSSAVCISRALDEIRRVLKPGGRLLFVEQDRADGPRTARWQDRLDPLWVLATGGRHLNRNISRNIENAGFRIEFIDTFRLAPLPRLVGRHCVGIASLR